MPHSGVMPSAIPTPDQPGPRAGMLLVATPWLLHPAFSETVVLLLEVDDDGALGVVLNRPSPLAVRDVLPAWGMVVSDPPVVFHGGPVGVDGALAVGLAPGPEAAGVRPGFDVLDGALGLVDLDDPGAVPGGLEQVRMFAGYSGWGRAQLDDEIREGSWYVVPSRVMDAFGDDAGDLHRRVLRRQPGERAWLSTRPLDPASN